MTTERFNVVLQGGTLRGQHVAAVATELAKLIKRDTDVAIYLLRGQPRTVKSGVDAATGSRYIEALERIGVAVRLEPQTLEVDTSVSAPPPIGNQTQTPTPTGVPQDYVDALMCLNLTASRFAASQAVDRNNAVRSHEKVASEMAPRQIVETQRLAREWKPK